MTTPAVLSLSPAELFERLLPHRAMDRGSPCVGDAAWVVDLDGGMPSFEDRDGDSAWKRLGDVSCPVVGVGGGGESAAARALAADVDVRASSLAGLEPLLETVTSAPLASAALTQLLRMNSQLDIDAALLAESFAYSTLQSGSEFAGWLASRAPAKPRGAAGDPVRVERRDDTLEITLDRPARRNAYSTAMRDALAEALEVAVADPSLQLVLRGAGSAFCSGGDLDEFGSLPDPATAHAVRTHRSPGRLLARIADRAVVQVHGACVGAGIELPAFASRVVATRDTFFQLPEVRMGLVPGVGGTVSLPRRIGRQRTAWLALSAQRLDAETALAWGLVDALN